MDKNDINNNFVDSEPQKPFTEKQTTPLTNGYDPTQGGMPVFPQAGSHPTQADSQKDASVASNQVEAQSNTSVANDSVSANKATVEENSFSANKVANDENTAYKNEAMPNQNPSNNIGMQNENPYAQSNANSNSQINNQNNCDNAYYNTGNFYNANPAQPPFYQQGYYNPNQNAYYPNSQYGRANNTGYPQNPQYAQYPQQPQNPQNPNSFNPQPMQGYPSFPHPYGQPRQNGYAMPNPPQNGYYPPTMPNQAVPFENQTSGNKKKKMSGGLIAVIIVLSVLLVGSFAGLFAYAILEDSDKASSDNNSGFSISPPNDDSDKDDSDKKGSDKDDPDDDDDNKSSDYSNQADKNYGGIELQDKPKDAKTNKNYTAETAFNKASDSVVGILCFEDEVTTNEYCDSQGSGIILTADGYVVTNSHVIDNSKTKYKIQVVTADGTKYSAGVVGYDTRTDIAVLKLDDAKNLTPAVFGDSDKIELGEDIISIGNPGGLDYQNSITKGIVSATDRKLSSDSLVRYIQTDAAINPGNSGGPIVNLYGQVIGISTAKIVNEQFEGMGFAIPSQTAKSIIDSLMKHGYVKGRAKIGITGVTVTAATAQSNNVPQGILVSDITEGGPCDKTGIRTNDIITKADNKQVTSFSDIFEILENHKPGDEIEIEYYRTSDGSTHTIKVTLQEDVL